MAKADSHDTTIATLPPASERCIPDDPGVARAVLQVGRQLDRLNERMQVAWSTPGDSPNFRKALEDWIEEMIDALDLMSSDPDLEDGDAGEENGDTEPSLGSTQIMNQERWSEGTPAGWWDADREQDPAESGIADSDALIEQGVAP